MTIQEVSKKYGIPQDTLRYYEKVGVIPPVHRTSGGIRDYTEEDCNWVEMAKCMRSAGLSIEFLIEYLKLFKQGDKTIPDRKELLETQKKILEAQMDQMKVTLDRLDYKISVYNRALKTGKLDFGTCPKEDK